MQNIFSDAKDLIFYKKKVVFNAGVEASIEYANPTKNYAPKIQLLLSPFGLPYVPLEILGTNTGGIISSLNWTKDRSSPGGIMSVTLVPDSKVIKKMTDIMNKMSFGAYSAIWGELGADLEDLFKPMALCQLWIDGYHVMTGTVRSISRSSSVSNNSKSVSYSVTIDELGNMYNKNIVSFDTMIFDNLQVNVSDAMNAVLESVSTLKGVSLADGIKTLINAWIASSLNNGFTMSDGFPLSARLLASSNPLGGISNLSFAQNMIVDTNLFELATQGGSRSIWSFLQSFIPSPWMEFFTESGGRTIVTDTFGVPSVLLPGFNYVVARSVPYSNRLIGGVHPVHIPSTLAFDLNSLNLIAGGDFVIVTDDDIQSKSIGTDCSNQSTVFHARYGSGGAIHAPDSTDKPIHAIGGLNRTASGGMATFGLIDMFQSIDCTQLSSFGTGASYVERIAKNKLGLPTQMMSKPALANLLAVWFRNQSKFREGTITTRYIPYARPGMYLLYLPCISGKKPENLRDIGMYYIDSVSHSYSMSNNSLEFSTTFSVIRGVPLPTTVAQSALLMFDFEVLPPESGLTDSELRLLMEVRKGITKQQLGSALSGVF